MNKILTTVAMLAALIIPAYAAPLNNPISPNLLLENGDMMGSGTYLGNGLVLTAAHVAVEMDKTVGDVRDDHGKKYMYQVLWTSSRYDVAMLKIVDAPDNMIVQQVDCSPNVIGEHVRMYGSPLGIEFIYTRGEVVGDSRMEGPWNTVVPIDGSVIPGQSGGAVVDDITGKLVGVTVGVANYEMGITGLGFIVPASAVCSMIGKQ